MTSPQSTEEGIGCRAVGITAMVLIGIAAALWTAGFLVGGAESCVGACEWASFTLIFGGTPVSAVFTTIGGQDLVLAWPVDILVWMLVAGLHVRLTQEAEPWTPRWNRLTVMFVVLSLAFGAVLALGVDRVR